MTVKDAEEKIVGRDVELLAGHHPTADEMDAYERVLGDAMAGDATLFAREDYVEEAWRIVDPVLAGAHAGVSRTSPARGARAQAAEFVPPGGWHDPATNDPAAF